jgi:hypothetical protein
LKTDNQRFLQVEKFFEKNAKNPLGGITRTRKCGKTGGMKLICHWSASAVNGEGGGAGDFRADGLRGKSLTKFGQVWPNWTYKEHPFIISKKPL